MNAKICLQVLNNQSPNFDIFSIGFANKNWLRSKVLKVWVATQTWVTEGQKMGRNIVIQICQNSSFKFFQFHHGIIIASYAFHVAS